LHRHKETKLQAANIFWPFKIFLHSILKKNALQKTGHLNYF